MHIEIRVWERTLNIVTIFEIITINPTDLSLRFSFPQNYLENIMLSNIGLIFSPSKSQH